MEITVLDAVEQANQMQASERSVARLNMLVAITVAFLATFMGICKVKDDNIVQGMQQAQANKLDRWAFYQARNIREEIAQAAVVQLRLAAAGKAPPEQAAYIDAIQTYDIPHLVAFAAYQASLKTPQLLMCRTPTDKTKM